MLTQLSDAFWKLGEVSLNSEKPLRPAMNDLHFLDGGFNRPAAVFAARSLERANKCGPLLRGRYGQIIRCAKRLLIQHRSLPIRIADRKDFLDDLNSHKR